MPELPRLKGGLNLPPFFNSEHLPSIVLSEQLPQAPGFYTLMCRCQQTERQAEKKSPTGISGTGRHPRVTNAVIQPLAGAA